MNNIRLRLTALPLAEKVALECYWLECDGMSNVIHYYLDKGEASRLASSRHRPARMALTRLPAIG
jgi:hypothetical protein